MACYWSYWWHGLCYAGWGEEQLVQRGGRTRLVTTPSGELFTRAWVDDAPADAASLVLVHGYGMSGRYMVPLAEELRTRVRVYAVDLPGFGGSSRPGRPLTIGRLADSLGEWLEAVNPNRPVVLGHSFGAQVVIDLFARRADLACGLVLLGPSVDVAARNRVRQSWRLFLAERLESIWLIPIVGWDFGRAGPRTLWHTLRDAVNDRPEEKVGRITLPTLVARGERDPISPQKWVEALTEALPKGRLAVIPKGSHSPNYSMPREAAEVLLPFIEGACAISPRSPGLRHSSSQP